MIRVVLADDHALVRAGLRALLENAGDIQVVGEAADGYEAVALTEQLHPTVLLLDIMMPRLNGLQAVAQVRARKWPTPILLLSMYADMAMVQQAQREGVQGYLLKSAAGAELLQAVRALAQGATYFSAAIAAQLVAAPPVPRAELSHPLARLTLREKEVLQLLAEGHTSARMAALLCISEKTVEKHRIHIMEKLGVHHLAGLVRLAVQFGLVEGQAWPTDPAAPADPAP